MIPEAMNVDKSRIAGPFINPHFETSKNRKGGFFFEI